MVKAKIMVKDIAVTMCSYYSPLGSTVEYYTNKIICCPIQPT